jgi:hypothetical protein
MHYRGDWLFCADYQPGEVVKSGGDYFMAVQQSAGKDPQDPLNSGYWVRISGGEPVPDHNDLDGLEGGDALHRYHLTEDAALAAEGEGPDPFAHKSEIIKKHNDLEDIDGNGTHHLSQDQAEAAQAANAPTAANPFATVDDVITEHNELNGVQGGRPDRPGEKYHLSKDASEAAEFAKNPSKHNRFLTKEEFPQFSRDISPFRLVDDAPEHMMLYGAAYSYDSTTQFGIFVAVGDNCAAHADKDDPFHWEADANVPPGFWRRAAGGGINVIVAVGLLGACMWRDASAIGGAWTMNPNLGADWNDITYGNGMFVAVGEGAVMKSVDGKTAWTLKAVEPGYGRDISFDNGYFYILGHKGVKRSVDCETWEDMDLTVEATWRTIAAGGGGHVVAIGGKCARSHDGGDSWKDRPLPVGGWEESVYISGFFMAIDGLDSAMVSEAERIYWKRRDIPNFAIRSLAAGNDTIVGVGSRIMIARVIDVGAALVNANGPNGSNPFATEQDVTDAVKEAVAQAVAEAKLYWDGVI